MHFLKLSLSFVGDLQQFSYEVRETTLIVFHKNMELQLISHRVPYHTTDFNYYMEIKYSDWSVGVTCHWKEN